MVGASIRVPKEVSTSNFEYLVDQDTAENMVKGFSNSGGSHNLVVPGVGEVLSRHILDLGWATLRNPLRWRIVSRVALRGRIVVAYSRKIMEINFYLGGMGLILIKWVRISLTQGRQCQNFSCEKKALAPVRHASPKIVASREEGISWRMGVLR